MDRNKIKFKSQEETLEIEKSNAIILHPSLGCPVIAEPDKPISIFLLTDRKFFNIFSKDFESIPNSKAGNNKPTIAFTKATPGCKGGGAIKRHINQMLNFTAWEEQKTFLAATEENIKPLFKSSFNNKNSSDTPTAEQSIEVTYLDELTIQNGIVNKEGKVFANIRKSILKRYKETFDLSYVFQVDISNLEVTEKKIYEFSWIANNEKPFCTPEGDAVSGPHDEQKYYSIQDQDTRDFITNTQDCESRKQFTHAYKVGEKDDDKFEFKFEFDPEVPIINHHPVWIAPKNKQKLNIGHLSDPHISVRQHAFKTCKAKVIQNANDEESPKIGDLVNVSFDTFKDLMDQLVKQDADILVITGDLIDHDINYNPKSKFIDNSTPKTGDIWKEMTLSASNINDDAKYNSSIDYTVIYSLIHRFYTEYNKPVFIISGNHENYKFPYGISPRLKTARTLWNNFKDFIPLNEKTESEVLEKSDKYRKKDWKNKAVEKDDGLANAKRANEGIPADHNLTIYEATLMYGPDYSTIPMAGTGKNSSYTNFRSETSDWFYQIFTPLTDFYFNYKGQTFIGLEWGDEEKILTNVSDAQVDFSESTALLGGVLPRANKCISSSQRQIIENAINEENSCNILMTHYTYTAYFPEKPHSEIGITNIIGKYEFGTFQENKDYVYKDLIKNNKIQYTLSGHTHRAGLYQLNNGSGISGWLSNLGNALSKSFSWGSLTPGNELYVKSIDLAEKSNSSKEPTENSDSEISGSSDSKYENGASNNSNFIYTGIDPEKTKMLVTSCAGPTGKQNFNNELFGLGTDYPSGAFIKYSDEDETVGIVRSKIETAKPRFAVAMEFADLVGREKLGKEYGIFKQIKLSVDGTTLDVKINDELKIPAHENGAIEKITLFINNPDGEYNYSYKTSNTSTSNGVLQVCDADIDDVEDNFISNISKLELKESDVFSSIRFPKFNAPAFRQYDYSTPLTIKSQMQNIKDVIREKYEPILMQASNPIIRQHIEQEIEQTINSSSGYIINRDPKHGEIANHAKLSASGNSDYAFDWDSRANEKPSD